MNNLELLKQLREETAAGILDIKNALEAAGGDIKQARDILRQKGFDKAVAKEGREVKAGLVESYVHNGGRVGSIIVLACETDFVARLDEFKALAHEIAMQVASMDPQSLDELLEQPYIRDSAKTIRDLITEVVDKTRENIKLVDYKRFQI